MQSQDSEEDQDPSSSNVLVQSILSATYPDADTAGSTLQAAEYKSLEDALKHAKKDVEKQVQSLSQDVAPDVDGWITRAKQAQHDIERSKATAREIIAEAESHASLQHSAREAAQKVDLLKQELAFSDSLEAALVNIQAASQQVAQAKEQVVANEVEHAQRTVSAVHDKIQKLDRAGARNASRLLVNRATAVQEAVARSCSDHVRSCLRCDSSLGRLDYSGRGIRLGNTDLETCVRILSEMQTLRPVVKDVCSGLQQCFLRIWEGSAPVAAVPRLDIQSDALGFEQSARAASIVDILEDIGQFVAWLADRVPKLLLNAMADELLPLFWDEVEVQRLSPGVPINLEELGNFDDVLGAVRKLATRLKELDLPGHKQLDEWAVSAPRVWLARQREHALESIRVSLISNLLQRTKAERSETRTVSDGDAELDTNDWDTEWKDESATAYVASSSSRPNEEDTSAWDTEEPESTPKSNGHGSQTTNDEDAAWGWEEEINNSPNKAKTQEPLSTSTQQTVADSNTITLRESYTVTGVPDELVAGCTRLLEKAHRLKDSQYADSAIAPGIAGLSSIPTLVTALYRAMALTAYEKMENGRMLLYNDSMRLADMFGYMTNDHGQAYIIDSTKRKLKQDIVAFERFARTAYSTEMEAQKVILRDMLEGAQGFSNCTTSPYEGECDMAVSLCVDRLRDVHRQWSSILSKSALLQSVGSLLGAVTSKMLVDVQELSDIGEEESKKLLSYIRSVSSISAVFTEQHADTGEVRDMSVLYCPNWLKFQYLGEILDGNLADIKYMWSESELSLEYDAEEVVDLIEALFAESDHRRKAIAEIRSNGR